MGKKLNKKDLKRSQKEVAIWLSVISIIALAIIFGIVISVERNNNKMEDKKDLSQNQPKQEKTTTVEIQTPKGNIKMLVYNDKMPITVNNFLKLVNEKFYDDITFHRVEDWVIQGGDPTATGTGGSEEEIQFEYSPSLRNVRGAVAMARSDDKNSATSQFYILKNDAPGLDDDYAVFGEVISGMDVVDKIEIGDKMISVNEVE